MSVIDVGKRNGGGKKRGIFVFPHREGLPLINQTAVSRTWRNICGGPRAGRFKSLLAAARCSFRTSWRPSSPIPPSLRPRLLIMLAAYRFRLERAERLSLASKHFNYLCRSLEPHPRHPRRPPSLRFSPLATDLPPLLPSPCREISALILFHPPPRLLARRIIEKSAGKAPRPDRNALLCWRMLNIKWAYLRTVLSTGWLRRLKSTARAPLRIFFRVAI